MVDSTSILSFTRDRTLIPGPPGHTISGTDWTTSQTRLTAVEKLANAINPYVPLISTSLISTRTHGLGFVENTTGTLQANKVYWTPIFLPKALNITRMHCRVEVPQPGATLTLGYYDSAWTLQQSFGTVNADTSGWKVAALGSYITIPAGQQWVAIRVNNVSDVGVRFMVPAFGMMHSSTTYGVYSAFSQTLAAGDTLPSTLTLGNWVDTLPFLGLEIA